MNFFDKVRSGDVRVVVVGAGYVGLPLAVEMARTGIRVTALDKIQAKVDALNEAHSYVGDVSDASLKELTGRLDATTDDSVLADADAVVICVPTPLRKTKDPDVSFIMDAAEHVAKHLHPGQLIVLESTTYPGFTREMLRPRLERTGLVVGKDFCLAFSPERVDPGNPTYGIRNTPKVVGGCTPECLKRVEVLYGRFIDHLVSVSSTDAAEMVKLLENTFRAVNIALVNEVSIMCNRLGLDSWEVIDAASTKPFGYMRFYPGPGLGGHCIPIDPHYLGWKLKTLKYTARFVELAEEVNASMPRVVVERVVEALNEHGKAVNGSKILMLGVAYKKDISDMRESPALDIIDMLAHKHADISYHDPFVEELSVLGREIPRKDLTDVASYDCVIIVTDHSDIDYRRVVEEAQLVVDTRNATGSFRSEFAGKVWSI
ncbi:MAG: nucleotide sugar dehydrogenase [Deltaproteobacteria bacterium]|nr:nucleotide sugar dehydrogenase [Deltaproteobacteria bacterium]